MTLNSGIRLGPYEIISPLGAGGMGEVYRARDARLNRDVALKVLPEIFSKDSERMARFEREAQVLASLNHPNIAALYGLEESSIPGSGSVRALVMELVEGPTLAERIGMHTRAPSGAAFGAASRAQAGPIPLDEALPIAKQIAEALEYAHENGVIHRDLKPANIKLTREAQVKVLDFGLAKAFDDDPVAGGVANSPTMSLAATRAGVILGTAGYMSPEQAKGKPADKRADIWSFGVVLYEMLAGKPMYSGETAAETLAAVLMKDPAFDALPESVPASMRKLLRRCLDKDPKHRLRDIGEARIAIEEALNGAPSQNEPAAVAPSPQSPSRPLAWMALAALFFVAAVVLAVLHFRQTPEAATAIRFSVSLPEKRGFRVPDLPVVSPDGKRIVWADSIGGVGQGSSAGSSLLRIRTLDSMTAQALPGTEGALLPFWSPDSRFVGFFAQGRLKKIEVSGGPALTLCNFAGRSGGGAWSPDGVIIFSQLGGCLYQVPAAGGEPQPLTELDKSRQETAHQRPQFLPDGRHFLYLVSSGDPNQGGVYLGSLDSKETRRLIGGDSNALYAPAASGPGHLLFARGEALMAQAFDPKSFRLSGEPFPIVEQVMRTAFPNGAAFSVSGNGVLAYRIGLLDETSQLVWFDRSGKRLEAVGEPGLYSNPSLSPDDKKIAVGRMDPSGRTRDLWTFDLTRGTSSRFTFDPADDTNPAWSPDGSRIAFTSERKGPRNIYQKVASGTGEDEPLLESGERKAVETWSRDGRFLVFNRDDREIWVLPLFGDRKPVNLLPGPGTKTQSEISPNGRWIAYRSGESGRNEIYVQSFSGTSAGPGKWQISTGGGTEPMWRRDGKELFYMSGSRLMAVDVKTEAATLEAGIPHALFEAPAVANVRRNRYVAAANGQRFLINTQVEAAGGASFNVVVNWLQGVKK